MKNEETENTDLKTKLLNSFRNFEKNLNGEAAGTVHDKRKYS